MSVDLSSVTDMSFVPNLYQVHLILDEEIVGENETRMALFTNWILAYRNVSMSGQRSSGKTYTTERVARLLPDKNGLYNLSKGSEKASWYQAEQLKAHSHIMVPELNKLSKDAKETLKDWGEGKPSQYKTVVFEGGIRRTQTYTLNCKPFVFCLADEEEMIIDEQLRSRLTIIRTDNSEQQNRAVTLQQAELAILPNNPKKQSEDLFKQMKHHIATLPPMTKIEFRHPAAGVFVECIPPYFTDCRRDFPKYLANTYGITRFYWKERMFIKKGDNLVFFVTPEDMYYNHIIYL